MKAFLDRYWMILLPAEFIIAAIFGWVVIGGLWGFLICAVGPYAALALFFMAIGPSWFDSQN